MFSFSTLLHFFSLLPLAQTCVSTYTVLSGPHTRCYSPALGGDLPTILIPAYATWVHDAEAQWVWWTTSWACDTISIKDTFVLAQWAVDRLSSAILKVTADDFFQVQLNGVMLKDFDQTYYCSAYLVYDIIAVVRGASDANYQENELEVTVESDCAVDGAIYRLEFTFT